MFKVGVLAGALVLAGGLLPRPLPAGGLQTLAAVPQNGFEGLSEGQDGSLYVTNASTREILRVGPDGNLSTFARLDAVPQVIVLTGSGAVVTAQEREADFGAISAAGGAPGVREYGSLGAQLLLLDRDGKLVRTLHGPAGSFFSGMALLGNAVLVSDSTAATIWRVDLANLAIEPWLTSPLLAGVDGHFPGGNGLKIASGTVYVANTSAGALYRVGVGPDGRPAGELQPFARLSGPDDFDVAPDGMVYVPSDGKLLRLAPDGSRQVLAENCAGCDSALLVDGGRAVVAVTRGFGPNAGPGRVLRFALDDAAGGTTTNPLGLKVHHITARVADIDRAVRWYRDMLGLQVGARGEGLNGAMKFADMSLPGFGISLMQIARPALQVKPGQDIVPAWVHIVFQVADPDRLYSQLRERGANLLVRGGAVVHPVRTFLLYDSEGNEIEIVADDRH